MQRILNRSAFQQCVVARRMMAELNLPIEIIAVPTVREPDGVAMSSCNLYVRAEEHQRRLLSAVVCSTLETERSQCLVARGQSGIWKDRLHLAPVDGTTPHKVESAPSQSATLCVVVSAG